MTIFRANTSFCQSVTNVAYKLCHVLLQVWRRAILAEEARSRSCGQLSGTLWISDNFMSICLTFAVVDCVSCRNLALVRLCQSLLFHLIKFVTTQVKRGDGIARDPPMSPISCYQFGWIAIHQPSSAVSRTSWKYSRWVSISLRSLTSSNSFLSLS